MEYKCSVILTKALILFVLVNCVPSAAVSPRQTVSARNKPCVACAAPCPGRSIYSRMGCTNCNKGCCDKVINDYFQNDQFEKKSCFDCNTAKKRCCDGVINDYFQSDQFENLFSNRDSLEAHAKGFWDYHSFIAASAHYQPYGFGTTYINSTFFGTKEVAAFLAHVGTRTSCEYFTVSVLGNFNLGFLLVSLVEYVCVRVRTSFLSGFDFICEGFKFRRGLIILCLNFEDSFYCSSMDWLDWIFFNLNKS